MAQSTSKQRRVGEIGPDLQLGDFRLGTTEDEAEPAPVLPCTPQQAAKLGEMVAFELESRTVEPFVARG